MLYINIWMTYLHINMIYVRQAFVQFYVRDTAHTPVVCVIVQRAGKGRNVTFQLMIVNLLTALGEANV